MYCTCFYRFMSNTCSSLAAIFTPPPTPSPQTMLKHSCARRTTLDFRHRGNQHCNGGRGRNKFCPELSSSVFFRLDLFPKTPNTGPVTSRATSQTKHNKSAIDGYLLVVSKLLITSFLHRLWKGFGCLSYVCQFLQACL